MVKTLQASGVDALRDLEDDSIRADAGRLLDERLVESTDPELRSGDRLASLS